MKLISKIITPLTHFWIEDHNDKDKTFFESIGFKEIKARMPKSFGGTPTLEFKGSGLFGGMSKLEFDNIIDKMVNFYGISKYHFTVEKMIDE